MRFRRQQAKARRDAKRRGSAFACRIAGVRSTEQSEAYTVRKEKSSTKTPGGPSSAKRVKGTRGDFEGNKQKHEETRSGAGVLLLVGLRECEVRSGRSARGRRCDGSLLP